MRKVAFTLPSTAGSNGIERPCVPPHIVLQEVHVSAGTARVRSSHWPDTSIGWLNLREIGVYFPKP